MVSIIRCTPEEAKHVEVDLETHTRLKLEWTWRVNRPRSDWKSGTHLTLIVAGRSGAEVISWLGWTTRLRRSGDLDEELEVSRVEPVTPRVPLDDVVCRLGKQHSRHLTHEGQQSGATGRALVGMLVEVRPDLREVIDRIEAAGNRYPIGDSPVGQIVALQRDATIGVARMAGMDASVFARWDRPQRWPGPGAVPPTFTGMLEPTAIEDRHIEHDARTMLGWFPRQTPDLSWTVLEGFGQRLLVVNANRTPAERTLGVDIIYYNAIRQSLIMVQYKKLNATRNGFYYPDSDHTLPDELKRMQEVDAFAARNRRPVDDYRLMPHPTWIKLCHPQAFIPQTADMVPGIYLANTSGNSERTHGSRVRRAVFVSGTAQSRAIWTIPFSRALSMPASSAPRELRRTWCTSRLRAASTAIRPWWPRPSAETNSRSPSATASADAAGRPTNYRAAPLRSRVPGPGSLPPHRLATLQPVGLGLDCWNFGVTCQDPAEQI